MSAEGLLATWVGPARRRAVGNDLLLAAPIALGLAAVAWRLGGLAAGLVVLALGVAAALLVANWRAKRFDRRWLTTRLDGARPDMEDSAELLLADPQALGGLQRLQQARLRERLNQGSPRALAEPWARRPIAILWIVALIVTAGALFWPRGEHSPVVLAPSAEGAAAPPGVPRLTAQNLRIIPPAYTGLPGRDERKLDARAPQGSRLEWTLRFDPQASAPTLVVLGGAPLPLRRSGKDWVASRTLDASFLYRVDPAPGRAGTPPLHRLDAIADAPPQVKALSPTESLTLVAVGQRGWTPVFAATDDYGVAASAKLRITLAIGEGENVTFSEREMAVTGAGPARDRRFSPRLDFAALGFGPGGDMVVQLIVSDMRAPGPQTVRGPSLILRWPSSAKPQSSGLVGMVNTTLPAYFRSQRQIIIDAEGLLARKRRLDADRYVAQSAVIGGDQQILRGRYSQFLGGEEEGEPELPTSDGKAHADGDGHDHGPPKPASAGFGAPEDVLAEFGHPHDDSPASSLDPQTRAVLKQAVDAMWLSERELKQGRPDLALPHANDALRFIKQVQQATRIFLSRVGPELPPIDAARRMTGKREGLASRDLPVAPVAGVDGPIAAAWRALGDGPDAIRGPIALDELDRWTRVNAELLPDPLALSGALDAVRRDPDCAACRQTLRGVLWTAMQRPPANLARRRPAEPTGARYLRALGAGQ